MSATRALDAVVGRHREGTPGLVHVAAYGIRRRPAILALFRRGRHRMPDQQRTAAGTPAMQPAL